MTDKTEVLYNAACPVCKREIDHYAKLSEENDLPIGYHDLGDAAQLSDWGMTEKDAAMRLHVRKGGEIYSGVPAFIVLWQDIPQMRWLARLVNLPGVHWVASAVYDHILAPLLYRWHLARMAKNPK